jgi:hypothetical protein
MTTSGSLALVAEARQGPERTGCVGGVDRMESKEERIGFNNINGLGKMTNDIKNVELHGFLVEGRLDVFGMTETNIHWRNNQTQAKDIMYGWFQRTHLSQQYYKEYPTTATFQVGGVLQVVTGDITSRVNSQGGDTSGQGRWAWHTLSGKAKRTIRIITAYRPVKNISNAVGMAPTTILCRLQQPTRFPT